MKNKMSSKIDGRELVLERVFDAPRELAFKAFSESKRLKQWWGPRGWTLPVCNVDFRPGGVWHYCMKCTDKNQGEFYGMESWGKAVYQDIVENEKIVYTDYFSDAEGNEAEGMPSSQITVTFTEEEERTRLVSRATFDSAEALKTVLDMGMEQGISETWDRLDEYLLSL
ncbi:SRPBCC domain-containing protein [Sporolactobacillus laevolacticus]|uniref:SRPBCC domain-containing protein n=1 Tax=Sporolactobacillus laevolacticus TaxID=33018 RepID=UPI0025B34EC4|nr:SRPBCC domain-containing protein [Sporolactobacillus laevolacticus]MDN3954514.1 SRPBCC domain-containing protein [Sporolactobacillus laevolacticus]